MTDVAARRWRVASPAAVLVLGGVVLALTAVAVPLAGLAHQSLNASRGSVPVWVSAPFAVVGLVLAWRKPGNPLGWIMLGAAVSFMLSEDASFYTVADYRLRQGGLPLGWVALLAQPGWAPGIVLFGVVVLLFPDGRPPSVRLRWLVWAYAGAAVLWIGGAVTVTVGAIIGHHTQVDSGGNLLLLTGTDRAAAWWNVAQDVFFLLLVVCWLVSLAGQVLSYRRSSGERRQQLKWLLAGSAVTFVAVVYSVTKPGDSSAGIVLSMVGFFAVPLSVGVAVLRYRLFDIDRIVSRTLAYAIVTGLLVGVYAGIVLLATHVVSINAPVAVAASTLAAAALFNPLRRRVQRVVDRRFNRAGYDADKTVAAFTVRLKDAVDLDSVRDDLLSVVQQALEPVHLSVWLDEDGGSVSVTRSGYDRTVQGALPLGRAGRANPTHPSASVTARYPGDGSMGRVEGFGDVPIERMGLMSIDLGMPQMPTQEPAPLAERRQSRQIMVGPVPVGGGAPVTVQSMTTTLTADVNATLQQIAELTASGCQIVRVAVPSQDDADALPAIARKSQIPVIADIHFQPKYVFAAIEAGCAAVRVNPGNIKQFDDKVAEIAKAAGDAGIPIRIGVNAGSLDKRLLAKYGKATPEALVESALWECSLFEEHGFTDIKISVKHHDPVVMINAYRLLAGRCDYPLHLGVTEAGPTFQGTIKSAVAFGALLAEGIGDTIRVSLSAPPVEEVKVGISILESLGMRQRRLEIVSCPSCGRAQVDVYKLAEEVTAGLDGLEVPLRVAVMGCVVNGPGEAREADLGVASGNGKGQIFVRGQVIATVPESAIVETLIEEAMRLAEQGAADGEEEAGPGRPVVTAY